MQCMLKINDCLTVGSIQINVIEVRHDSVKLGIEDPSASPTYREEILYIRSENDEADDGDNVDFEFEPFQIEEFSPYAIPIL
jgi:carbon storage regulator CsrA